MSRSATRPRPSGARAAGLATLALLAVALAWSPGAAAMGVNLVRLTGVLGVEGAPHAIMDTTLLVDGKKIPFSVLSAQRLSNPPADGSGVLLPIGTDRPIIRLIGESSFLRPLGAAPSGTELTLIGNLNYPMSYLEVMGADVAPSLPSPGAQ